MNVPLLSGEIPSPTQVAAWLRLKMLPTEDVPLWAAHWLLQGFDGHALAELAGFSRAQLDEINDLVMSALADCGIPVPPTRVAAYITVLEDLARLQISGRAGERSIAQTVDRLLAREHKVFDRLLEQPLGGLYCLDDEWSGGWGRTDDELKESVRSACLEQLRTGPLQAATDRTPTTLWRPTGPAELAQVEASGWRAWPARLADQPIFYPVLDRDYAIQIAREWNVPNNGRAFVTEFEVEAEFLERYDVHQVGGHRTLEYWIPAEQLVHFNASIVGQIRVIAHFGPDLIA